MRWLFLLLTALTALPTLAQTAVTRPVELTNSRQSPERKALLDALRARVSRELGQPVVFVVKHLKRQGDWAFYRGHTRRADGGEIAWEKQPAYRELVADGVFDGDGTAALLHRVKGQWQTATYVIGPTDVAWACWWKEYGAPRAIFDLAEECQ